MPLPTFSPPVAPSPGTAVKRTLRLLEAEFGDGYQQPTPDGMNHMRKTLTLAWDGLTEAQMLAIDGFLAGQGGTEPFAYQPVGHAAPLAWTCDDWTVKRDGVWKIAATFKQAFSAAL